jgi:hypothetical protein
MAERHLLSDVERYALRRAISSFAATMVMDDVATAVRRTELGTERSTAVLP